MGSGCARGSRSPLSRATIFAGKAGVGVGIDVKRGAVLEVSVNVQITIKVTAEVEVSDEVEGAIEFEGTDPDNAAIGQQMTEADVMVALDAIQDSGRPEVQAWAVEILEASGVLHRRRGGLWTRPRSWSRTGSMLKTRSRSGSRSLLTPWSRSASVSLLTPRSRSRAWSQSRYA